MSRINYIFLFLLIFVAKVGAQNNGVPFFRNITAQEYKGHNRNTDILCDRTGCVYVANFEGLLIFDGIEWTMHHTPGISRVTSLYKAKNGKIWFGGNNVVGYVSTGDSINLHFVADEKSGTLKFGEILSMEEHDGSICFTTNEDKSYKIEKNKILPCKNAHQGANNIQKDSYDVSKSITIKERMFTATTIKNGGIRIYGRNGSVIYSLTKENGLCSNTINDIDYDGKGSIWGATDNGLFYLSTSQVFSQYGEAEGLIGQVTSIINNDNTIYAGTLQGLYKLENNTFQNIGITNQACWQMARGNSGSFFAATVDGVYEIGASARQISHKHALSVLPLSDGELMTGELDGIYSYTKTGESTLIDKIPNVVKFEKDAKGGIWVMTLYNETYYRPASSQHFSKKANSSLSLLFSYTDANNGRWYAGNNGMGLNNDNMPHTNNLWLRPLSNHIVQAMIMNDGVAWIGGTYGIIRFDTKIARLSEPFKSQIYIRKFAIDGSNIQVTMSNDKIDPIGKPLYSYRMREKDNWSSWRTDNKLNIEKLTYGRYQFTVRSLDAFGLISVSDTINFEIPVPIFFRWYALLFYLLTILFIGYAIARVRMRRLEREQERLESIVEERTRELKTAQKQLIRKEREATIGKLTKGLIDRILNPMNYINNFSHLSIGLTKDLNDNMEDINDSVNGSGDGNGEIDKEEFEELYEDSLDVIDMMKQNLDKIEQHGMATTRILKAMEEMLKERSGTRTSTDICTLLQQNYEMLCNYYSEDISKYAITTEWEKPSEEITSEINAEQISRTIMSILANCVYAIKKKCEKIPVAAYQPIIRMQLTTTADNLLLKIYDNGIGIEQSIIDKVFDPFFTTKPTAEASGVGLYLCQQIVQDHGGTISLQSGKDEYTEITLTLPLS